MKKRSIFDIINTSASDYDELTRLADGVREKHPEAAGYLDEASMGLQTVNIALHNYLSQLLADAR